MTGMVGIVAGLRAMALRGLTRMYRPDTGLFPFRVRRSGEGYAPEGESFRYTAIALIGLAGEKPSSAAAALSGATPADACARLVRRLPENAGLGDASLAFWACCAAGVPDRRGALDRMLRLRPEEGGHPTVEAAWALAALCGDPRCAEDVRDRLAKRLAGALDAGSGVFPHRLAGDGAGPRSHVSCFADMVYPIHALSLHHTLTGDRGSLAAASLCAGRICGEQGPAGQWWWHYDRRTGDVVERYPVYAVHQDAMAPMALFALREAGGTDCTAGIARGLAWLCASPELCGETLIDRRADIVWRKVARREPGKLSRYAQAAAAGIHPSLRVPGLDILFPPVSIDYEDRPYHLGWLLYAFNEARLERMGKGGAE